MTLRLHMHTALSLTVCGVHTVPLRGSTGALSVESVNIGQTACAEPGDNPLNI